MSATVDDLDLAPLWFIDPFNPRDRESSSPMGGPKTHGNVLFLRNVWGRKLPGLPAKSCSEAQTSEGLAKRMGDFPGYIRLEGLMHFDIS